jgi:rhamnosyltransferase
MSRPSLKKNNICALVITYFPGTRFPEYLQSIRKQCGQVCIIDNGSTGVPLDMLENIHDKAVHVKKMGRNTGLGTALNEGVALAKTLGYRWVILFDQDSQPLIDMVKCFASILSTYPNCNRIALIGSRFIDRNKTSHVALSSLPSPEPRPWIEKRRVITSGMLLAMDAFDDIGPFREDFFIDTIDHEFCYRAQRKGWHVLQTASPVLIHSVGDYRPHRIFGRTIWRSHHSALRCYFMTRNPMILAREEKDYTKLLRGVYKALVNSFYILLFEDDKLKKLHATLLGYFHGLQHSVTFPQWLRQEAERDSARTPES